MEEAKNVFFGQKKVKEFELVGESVFVEFEDGIRENIGKQEWEIGKSELPVEENREWFLGRLRSVSAEISETLRRHNVRLEEIGDIFTMVRDGIQLAINQAKEASFETPAWTARLGDIQRVLDKQAATGKKIHTQNIRIVRGGLVDF